MKRIAFALFFIGLFSPLAALAQSQADFTVTLECSEVKDIEGWAKDSQKLIQDWYPRIRNLMASPGFEEPKTINLVFKESDEGIAFTAGNMIEVHSGWVRQHPEDIGLVFHEMIHVLQQYGRTRYWWITEGTADYYRWAIYEGKPLKWFPVTEKSDGYSSGYQVTAGFLLWLDSEKSSGIVSKINAAMRNKEFSPELFKEQTGSTVEELWQEYLTFRKSK